MPFHPIHFQHSCTTFNYTAFPASIVTAHFRDSPSFLNYLIQLHFPSCKLQSSLSASFRSVPEINWRLLARHGGLSISDIRPTLIDTPRPEEALCHHLRGHYLYLFLDHYYLQPSPAYGCRHYFHDVLLTGFDPASNSIYLTLGFDRTGKQGIHQISLETLALALLSEKGWDHYAHNHVYHELQNFHPIFREPIYAIAILPNEQPQLSPTLMVSQLNAYLNGTWDDNLIADTWEPIMRTSSENGVYGINAYDSLFTYIGRFQKAPDFDFRATRLLYEHKMLMVSRLKYLSSVLQMDLKHPIETYSSLGAALRMLHQACVAHATGSVASSFISTQCALLPSYKAIETDAISSLLSDI